MTDVFCAAHRGLSATHPENTLQALEEAVNAGFPAIEMDLRLTRDKEVVVLHDAGIERTTKGSGRVADMRYDELRAYPTAAGPVPRLDDLMARLESWEGLWDLEVKDPKALVPMLEVMEHHHIGVRAMVTAMEPAVLRQAQDLASEHPRGLIVLGPPDDEDHAEARRADCGWMLVDHQWLDEDVVDEVQDAGLRLGAWTCNDTQRADELARLGAECIITDTDAVLRAMEGAATPEPWF